MVALGAHSILFTERRVLLEAEQLEGLCAPWCSKQEALGACGARRSGPIGAPGRPIRARLLCTHTVTVGSHSNQGLSESQIFLRGSAPRPTHYSYFQPFAVGLFLFSALLILLISIRYVLCCVCVCVSV